MIKSILNNKGMLFALLSGAAMSANAYNMTVNDVAPDIDWSKVPVVEKTMFFPGMITYKWINSPAHPGTQRADFETKTCSSCHQGEEKGLGEQLIKHDRLDKMIGKEGSIEVEFQFANDNKHLYVKATWPTRAPFPARMHDPLLFENGKWTIIGGDRGKNPYTPIYEDRFSIMIDDGSVDQFTQQGCWMSCHQGMRDIGQATARDVLALDVIGAEGLKRKDIRKYLPETRTERFGINWGKPKTREEIETRNKAEQFAYQVERDLNEMGDKAPAAEKAQAEEKIATIRQLVKDNADNDKIEDAIKDLGEIFKKIGEAALQAGAAADAPAGAEQQAGPEMGGGEAPPPADDDVIDADFKETKEE